MKIGNVRRGAFRADLEATTRRIAARGGVAAQESGRPVRISSLHDCAGIRRIAPGAVHHRAFLRAGDVLLLPISQGRSPDAPIDTWPVTSADGPGCRGPARPRRCSPARADAAGERRTGADPVAGGEELVVAAGAQDLGEGTLVGVEALAAWLDAGVDRRALATSACASASTCTSNSSRTVVGFGSRWVNASRRGGRVSWRIPAVVSWAGARGVLPLAAALSIPLTTAGISNPSRRHRPPSSCSSGAPCKPSSRPSTTIPPTLPSRCCAGYAATSSPWSRRPSPTCITRESSARRPAGTCNVTSTSKTPVLITRTAAPHRCSSGRHQVVG
jgi:hypothetical protein